MKEILEFYKLIATYRKTGWDNSGWREEPTYYDYTTEELIGIGTKSELNKMLTSSKLKFAETYKIELIERCDIRRVSHKLFNDCYLKLKDNNKEILMHLIHIDTIKLKLQNVLNDSSIYKLAYNNIDYHESKNSLDEEYFIRHLKEILSKNLISTTYPLIADMYSRIDVCLNKSLNSIVYNDISPCDDWDKLERYLNLPKGLYPKPMLEAIEEVFYSLRIKDYSPKETSKIYDAITNKIIEKSPSKALINQDDLRRIVSYLKFIPRDDFRLIDIKYTLKPFENFEKEISSLIDRYSLFAPIKKKILDEIRKKANFYSKHPSRENVIISSTINNLGTRSISTRYFEENVINKPYKETTVSSILNKLYSMYPEYKGYNFISTSEKCYKIPLTKGKYLEELFEDADYLFKII
ncbi:hypothetical protein [Clostridium culturomicium]|uniref:hypothetical protein n=1 Tax=Clostridium culturomicium TaxID=1499683 RepID=UPI00058E6ADF|nr:hypothetical protein [Clostridium culturomicium]